MLVEVKEGNEVIRKLLSYSIGYPTDEKISLQIEQYFHSDMMNLYCTQDHTGIVGVDYSEKARIEIKHIAVDQERRLQSIGRKMIKEVEKLYKGSIIFLETDDSAVGFYRKCGFSVESLGEKYPGVIRYYCEKRT